MSVQRLYRGWVPLLGVPTLFLTAFIMGLYPLVLKVPICGVKFFIGLDCPGCGLTRSFAALMHGHLRESIDFHPLGLVIALWLAYMFMRALFRIIIGRPMRPLLSDRTRFLMLNAFLFALLTQWILGLLILR
jgi:hypothetical protein